MTIRPDMAGPAHIMRVERCLMAAAQAAEINPAVMPVFERIAAELTQLRALTDADPLGRARALLKR